jgi:hypothetical protein
VDIDDGIQELHLLTGAEDIADRFDYVVSRSVAMTKGSRDGERGKEAWQKQQQLGV